MGLFRRSTGIELCIDDQYYNGYERFKKSTIVDKKAWELHLLRGCPAESYGYASVTTTIRKPRLSNIINTFPFWSKHVIPVVDCDSMENLIIAKRVLDLKRFKYATYTSSLNKYWLIIDVACKIHEAIIHMRVPGNDDRFVEMCRKLDSINLRISPKAGYLTVPEMIDNTCTNKDVLAWIDDLNKILASTAVRDIYEIMRIDHALEAGEAINLISSPEFTFPE